MKIAFIIYNGMNALDFISAYEIILRLDAAGKNPSLEWEICSLEADIRDSSRLRITPTRVGQSLADFDALFVPGGRLTVDAGKSSEGEAGWVEWLKTAAPVPLKSAANQGVAFLGAAGFLEGRMVAASPGVAAELQAYGARISDQPFIAGGGVATASGLSAGALLGQHLAAAASGPTAGTQPVLQASGVRRASIQRTTRETRINLNLDLDGNGRADIQTGLGFLDHMLAHIAVHGLFDLEIQAQGDLDVDPHHTVEDIAICLGQAFNQALGERRGIIRTASCHMPMDETLAWTAVDLSGRPYTVFQGQWHSPSTGGIPTSLIPHFFESFAAAARCNLHAQIVYGRDDHHQAEALFKALARALETAVRIDPRRAGAVPSTKGTLNG